MKRKNSADIEVDVYRTGLTSIELVFRGGGLSERREVHSMIPVYDKIYRATVGQKKVTFKSSSLYTFEELHAKLGYTSKTSTAGTIRQGVRDGTIKSHWITVLGADSKFYTTRTKNIKMFELVKEKGVG